MSNNEVLDTSDSQVINSILTSMVAGSNTAVTVAVTYIWDSLRAFTNISLPI